MDANPPEQVLQVATAYMASAALYVAVELDIAERLAGGPKSSADLAESAGANEGALYRILRLLASLGIFTESGPRTFSNNAASELLCQDTPGSLKAMARFLPDPIHFRIYANLKLSALAGTPAADGTFGQPLFQYLAENPDYSEIFNDAMTSLSAPVAGAAIEVYDFSRFGTIVDVAGGHGEVLLSILRACPDSKGILAEIDHVVAGARPRIEAAGLADRCEAVACDFFESVPAGGDAYVMKHIIHDWDDDRSSLILENIGRAMGAAGGTVVLLECVVSDGPEPDLAKFIDMEMLALPGGRERTESEFRQLFDRAGFELTQVIPTQSPLWVIEAVRR